MDGDVKRQITFRPDVTMADHIRLIRAYLNERAGADRAITDSAVVRYALDIASRAVYVEVQRRMDREEAK